MKLFKSEKDHFSKGSPGNLIIKLFRDWFYYSKMAYIFICPGFHIMSIWSTGNRWFYDTLILLHLTYISIILFDIIDYFFTYISIFGQNLDIS